MKNRAWVGLLEKMVSTTAKKTAADNQRLVIHFTHFGATLLHADLEQARPRILRFFTVQLDPTMTDQEKKNAFLDCLSKFKFKEYPPAAITWPDGMTFRQLQMPPMPADDLSKAIEWDLKKKYYYNPEENLIGYREAMEVDGAEGTEKLLNIFYCEKKLAASRLSFVQELGLEIRSMIPSQAALANFAQEAEPAGENDMLICEFAGTLVRILVVHGDRNMLVRQVTLGSQEFNWTDEILQKVSEEIKKTIDFYESQKYFRPVAKVVLAGLLDEEERVHAFLSQRIETKVVSPDMEPFLSAALGEEDRQFAKIHGGLFAAALGAADFREESMNLVPEDIKNKNRERHLEKWLNLCLMGMGVFMFLVVAGTTANAHFMKGGMRVLENEYEEINQKKKTFESILGLEKVRRAMFKGEVYSPSLLKELSYRTPAIITLTEMQYSRQDMTLVLHGEVLDSARENTKSVTQYAANLAESPFFTSAVVSNTNRDEERKVLQFEVDCKVRGLL